MPGKRKWTAHWNGVATLALAAGYQLEYRDTPVLTGVCRLCDAPLKLNRTQTPEDKGIVIVQPCACRAGANVVNLNRFLSIFDEPVAHEFYKKLKQQKQRNWTTVGLDVASEKSFISRYGEEDGKKRYAEKQVKCNTVSLSYFEGKGLSAKEAKHAQKHRQTVGALNKYFERHGPAGIDMWILRNAKWRSKITNTVSTEAQNYLEPSLMPAAESKAQYWWLTTVLTDLSRRLFLISAESDQHIDHRFSRTAAFHLAVSPKILCSPINLRAISKQSNLSKKDLCELSHDDLVTRYNNWITEDPLHAHYDNISETLLGRIGYDWAGW